MNEVSGGVVEFSVETHVERNVFVSIVFDFGGVEKVCFGLGLVDDVVVDHVICVVASVGDAFTEDVVLVGANVSERGVPGEDFFYDEDEIVREDFGREVGIFISEVK